MIARNGFWVLIFLIAPIIEQAQTVTNINKTIKVAGVQAFYMHTVLEGQTVEAITSAYYADLNEVLKYNPEAKDGLTPDMVLKIPVSDDSIEPISKLPRTVPAPTNKPASVPPKPTEPTQKSTSPEPKKQVTPMQEAVQLLELTETQMPPAKNEVEVPVDSNNLDDLESTDSAALLQSISELSQGLNESLEQLKSIKAQDAAPDKEASSDLVEESESIAPKFMLGEYLPKFTLYYFESHPDDSICHISEYFFANINKNGVITSLKDERTSTNKNTKLLDINALIQAGIDNYTLSGGSDSKIALAIETDVERHVYQLKVKRSKVRVYNLPLYLEHFPKNDPRSIAILEKAEQEGKRGKCEVELWECRYFLGSKKPFEYNPFGAEGTTYFIREGIVVQKMMFR